MVDVVKMFGDFERTPLVPLNSLPNEIGIYWLADHSGRRRYIAKKLRRHFIRCYCTAACLPLTMAKNELEFIERRFIAMARPEDVLWNDSRSRSATFGEPEDLVSALIDELGWSEADRVCLERQKSRSSISGN